MLLATYILSPYNGQPYLCSVPDKELMSVYHINIPPFLAFYKDSSI